MTKQPRLRGSIKDERRQHYWICTQQDGQPILIYGCPAHQGEEAARQKGIEMLCGINFELHKFPTRDTGKAAQMWKGRILETGHNLRQATTRQMHEGGLKRHLESKRRRQEGQ